MKNFIFFNPARILFGKGQLAGLADEIKRLDCKRILVVSGRGSVKRIGLYDKVISILKDMGLIFFELEGIHPNPRLADVRRGIDICKRNNVDFILAVGGGSVIDAGKAIAAGAVCQRDIWDYFAKRYEIEGALPLGDILTLAATGTEMNGNAVITNWETKDKLSIGSSHLIPKFSILDPEYTYSVPKDQTVYGIVDIMAHVFEAYFSPTPNTPLHDRIAEGIMTTLVENAYKVLDNLKDYDARANIMWCGSMALNGLIGTGKEEDWATHDIEHEVSAIYDIPHGGGLAIIFPNWMKYVLDEGVDKFVQYAQRVWNVQDNGQGDREIALEGIQRTREFFDHLGAPSTLKDYGIGHENIDVMAQKAVRFGPIGGYKKLYKEDVANILKMCL
ncbi:MAG TPA: iron-containing alcohol dehydrogenase [Clostridiales bacterium]|nr:iron-containing alcohol dehydrogenase [Clostridiales bacterium]